MLKDGWLDAPAYRRLSAAARAVLTELLRRENGSNNGRIRFSGADHLTVGHADRQKTDRALRELRAEGFVVETRPTGRSGKPGVSRENPDMAAHDDRGRRQGSDPRFPRPPTANRGLIKTFRLSHW